MKSRIIKLAFLARYPLLFAAVIIIAFSLVATVTYALLHESSDPVTNTFTSATPPDVTVKETFTDGDKVKKDVYVSLEDTGYACYVRAMVVVTWQDRDGNVYGQMPTEGEDYEIDFGDDWKKIGDFWYYNVAVADHTSNLIDICTALFSPDGYDLHVMIIAQAVQSEPKDAVRELWGTDADAFTQTE